MSNSTILLPFQSATMSRVQQAAVSYLARYSGVTHNLYDYQLRQWFAWCETKNLDPLSRSTELTLSSISAVLGTAG